MDEDAQPWVRPTPEDRERAAALVRARASHPDVLLPCELSDANMLLLDAACDDERLQEHAARLLARRLAAARTAS